MGMCLAGAEGDDKIKGQLHCIILGVAGSGKSTFTKQLRLLDNQTWSATELEDFRNVIRRDLLIGLQELIGRCDKLKFEIAGENKKYARIFIELMSLGQISPKFGTQKLPTVFEPSGLTPQFKRLMKPLLVFKPKWFTCAILWINLMRL